MILIYVCFLSALISFCVSGIFQKPPGGWWTTVRHLIWFFVNFGFLKRNRLAAYPWLPSDADYATQFSGFSMNDLAVVIDPPGDASPVGSILVIFFGFWDMVIIWNGVVIMIW